MAGRDLQPASRAPARRPARAGDGVHRVADGAAPLLLCTAGPHRLVFDLRSLMHIDVVEADVPLLPGQEAAPAADEVDLRRALGAEGGAPQALLYALEGDPRLRRMVVDAGSLRLRSVALTRVHALPAVLAGAPGLRLVRGVVELDDGALAWLVDPARLAEGAA
ncbi:MAG: hypothetical protein KF878_25645 [Planctomycetes bacterium]|nr:hypothetical protein [Planctomycetota bacterium]